jgi:ADP-ribose pyrophosphatase
MKKFKVLSKEKLIESQYCPVERHEVEFPDGGKGEWFVNTSADAVIVVPITTEGKVILQRSYKHGGGEEVVEFCAGIIDEGETPEVAAARELQEETGFKSERFEKIGEVFANPTGSSMKYHFFLARNCSQNGTQDLDPSEQIEVFFAEDWASAVELLTDSQTTTSSATIAGIGFANRALSS